MVFWRRRNSVVANPGDVIELNGVARVRVWDVCLEVDRRGLALGERRFRLSDLPQRWERYEVRAGAAPGTIVVDVVRPSDRAFHGPIDAWCEAECTPVVPFEFEGIAIDGPRRVDCAESIANDWASDGWVSRRVPRFVVSGVWRFSGTTLNALGRDPSDAIELVIEDTSTGEVQRRRVDAIWDTFEYEVLGISVHPAEPPPRAEGSLLDDSTSVGGYFNAPMGLFVGEPTSPYRLRVYAECGAFRSNAVEIEIRP